MRPMTIRVDSTVDVIYVVLNKVFDSQYLVLERRMKKVDPRVKHSNGCAASIDASVMELLKIPDIRDKGTICTQLCFFRVGTVCRKCSLCLLRKTVDILCYYCQQMTVYDFIMGYCCPLAYNEEKRIV